MSHSIYLCEGEVVVHRAHYHWNWILPLLFRAMAMLLLFAGLVYLAPGYFIDTTSGKIITFVYVLGVFLYVFSVRKMHHMSFLSITSHRVIRVDRHQFLHSSIAEMPFDRIENVRSSVHGFWGTLLKYGTIEIYTAGDEGQIVVGPYLADPVHTASVILKYRKEYLKAMNLTGAEGHWHNSFNNNSSQNQPQNVISYIPAMPSQFYQNVESQQKSVEGFVSHAPKVASSAPKHKDSYLVDLLANSDEFKNSVVGSLADEISSDNSKRGRRLVRTITSTGDFRKKVVDDLTKDLLE